MYTLLDHLTSLNAEAQKWAEENNGWSSMWTLDLDHWAEMGIHTAADFIRYNLINSISDASKDLYGSRMRLAWDNYSIEELQYKYDCICDALNAEFEMEQEREAYEAEMAKGLPDDCEPLPYEEYADLEEMA